MIKITEQDRQFAAELDAMPRHFCGTPKPEGKVALNSGWRINVLRDNIVAGCGATSLSAFLRKYCDLDLLTVFGEEDKEQEIRIRWEGTTGEGFKLNICSEYIEIAGDSPAGALYGVHRLQWMMCDNGGPYLEAVNTRIEPCASTRVVSTQFHQGFDTGGDPLTYSDGYLDLMAHYGCNGLHMYVDIFDYIVDSSIAPELNDPGAAERISKLAELALRAEPYNIGIYLHVNSTKRSPDHPVFKSHPELKGAISWGPDWCCLCSSEPKTAQLYGQTINNIISKVPQTKGVIAIVGGECLLHCYTRPYPRTDTGTNCPRCSQKTPSETVSDFANAIARFIWDDYPDTEFVVWPYSAHLWSETPEQQELIKMLDSRIGFMTCFDKDAWIEVDGAETSIFDYSISYIGPSPKFELQHKLASERGMPFYIKTESSIAIEMLSLPYVPVMENWQQRWSRMMSYNPMGYIGNWRFTGMNGTLSDEVAYRECWKDSSDTLPTMAARLAGKDGKEDCLSAWASFSRAYDELKFCPGLSGFPYFRGPMHLGPSHPLILLSEEGSRLPRDFFQVDPCLVEVFKDDEIEQGTMSALSLPLYFDDYRWTLPLGIERMHRSLKAVCKHWDEGLATYEKVFNKAAEELKPVLRKEIDVAWMAGTTLHSTLNLARFQMEREHVLAGPISNEDVDKSYVRMKKIVDDDLANSRKGLELAKNHFRYGYGFVYGRAFTPEMVEAKINFTEQVLIPDIDQFYYILVSHAFARSFGTGGRYL